MNAEECCGKISWNDGRGDASRTPMKREWKREGKDCGKRNVGGCRKEREIGR